MGWAQVWIFKNGVLGQSHCLGRPETAWPVLTFRISLVNFLQALNGFIATTSHDPSGAHTNLPRILPFRGSLDLRLALPWEPEVGDWNRAANQSCKCRQQCPDQGTSMQVSFKALNGSEMGVGRVADPVSPHRRTSPP